MAIAFDFAKLCNAADGRITYSVLLGRYPGGLVYRMLGVEGSVRPDGSKTHQVFLYQAGPRRVWKEALTSIDGDYTCIDANYDADWGEDHRLAIVWAAHNQRTGSDEPVWRHVLP